MPGTLQDGNVKRKRPSSVEKLRKRARSESSSSGDDGDDHKEQIFALEAAILQSKKNYNNISTLIEFLKNRDDTDTALAAAVALCRVYIRLLAAGALRKSSELSDKEVLVVQWLRARLAEYKEELLLFFTDAEAALTALTLSMRLLKAESSGLGGNADYRSPEGHLLQIVRALLQADVEDGIRQEFVEKFVDQYDDVRFYTFKSIKYAMYCLRKWDHYSRLTGFREALEASAREGDSPSFVASTFDLLQTIEGVPGSNEDLQDFYVDAPRKKSHALYSLNQHKRQAQEAWLALLRLDTDKERRKRYLDIMARVIAPWFTQPELLADFLTDCYNIGGSMSLLALSGVFYLIQERNLDYPSFYSKLYSLLDADLLHSKHRSRFFRLLETFLDSSHLPAALVASFIKRMSRLCLNAPPSAIVAVVPWIYNLHKTHPSCTFMIHRVARSEEEREQYEEEGLIDPFLPDETDPMATRAIDSCLWEIVQLQSHYHPNVATIAKIISEQFTKEFYKLEDFLDHSYGSLLDAELAKQVKKAPVVEFIIPKKIFRPAAAETDENDSLLTQLWDFGFAEAVQV